MGSGKSTIGSVIARVYRMDSIDTDRWIERREKLSVSMIYEKFGEEYFLEKERELMKKIGSRKGLVVSTGGETLFDPGNLEIMKKEQVDTLILGCTHYPHLSELISDIMGSEVTLISSGAELAKYALKTLSYNDALCGRDCPGELKLFCTDSEELFRENVQKLMDTNINAKISKCTLKF